MSINCNTCDKIIPTTCIRYQGGSLYFEKELEDKRDLEEIVKKISDKLKVLEDTNNTKLDKKGLDVSCDVKTPMQFIQYLIDKEAERNLIQSNQTTTTSTNNNCCDQLFDVSILGSSCSEEQVNITQALLMLLNEVQFLKQQISNNQSNIYIPNV